MRPQKLTISAWGPYPGEEMIDFNRVGSDGLFLITGPTGGGKTTLFDAISYALYGAVSGKTREKASVRSDFAASQTPTFVRLEFAHRGQDYVVVRSPRYSRPKKRGSGEIVEPEKATLIMPDGREYSQVTQVNQQILTILGINHEQFKQVSMIAQGEFMELLTADSAKRVEIFRSIFGTGIFHRIQMLLGEKSRSLENEMRDLNHRMEEAVAGIIADGQEALCAAVEAKPWNYREISTRLSEDIKDSTRKYKAASEQIEALSRELQEITLAAQKVSGLEQELEKVSLRLKQHRQQQARLLEEKPKIDRAWEQKDGLEAELSAIGTRLARCGDYIRWCRDFTEKSNAFLAVSQELLTLEKQKELFAQKEKQWQENVQKCQEYIEGLSDIDSRVIKAQNEVEKQKELVASAQQFVEKCGLCQNMRTAYGQCQTAYKAADEVYQKADARFRSASRASMQAAAGLLAKELSEGQPCPVCGSTTHPHLASMAEDVPSEAQLKRLEQESERCRKKMMEAFQQAVDKKGQYEAMERELQGLYEGLVSAAAGGGTMAAGGAAMMSGGSEAMDARDETSPTSAPGGQPFSLEAARSLGNEAVRLRTLACEDALKTLEEARKSQAMKEKTRESLAKFQKAVEEIQARKEKLLEHYGQRQLEAQAAKGRMEEARNRLASELGQKDSFDENAFIREKKALEAQAAKIREKQKKLEAEHQRLYSEMASNEALIRQDSKNEEQLQGTLEAAYAAYPGGRQEAKEGQRLFALKEQLAVLQAQKDTWALRISHNRQAAASIDEKLVRQEKLAKEYGCLKDLDNAARGNNSMKLTFEQYVLGAYFDEVLAAANLRLDQMSGGRYEMLRVDRVLDYRKTNSLDIEVMDYYTGKKRSVRTLSGGESFNAALSLALGLSDVIQCHAGGIEIEALFIDEGFGSLDEVSLQSAVDTLMTVTADHHMTGIISHVQELKERIRHQIVIEKQRSGSRVKACL